LLVFRVMNVKQLPYGASALAMVGGLYLLAGPFREDHSDLVRLLPLWGVLLAYEALVIGMIAVLHRRGVETAALRIVSILFLADPLLFGDAFASGTARAGLALNGAAFALSLGKAWALARAVDYRYSPWLAGWAAGALGFIHLYPSLIALPAARPGQLTASLAGAVALSVLAVPLLRSRRIGWAAVVAMALHHVVGSIVHHVPFEPHLLIPPLLAASCVLPWPRLGWAPLAAAVALTPARGRISSLLSTADGLGAGLVAAAFALLAFGFLRAVKTPLARNPRPPTV